jgi:iron complex outermembrane receptor protein
VRSIIHSPHTGEVRSLGPELEARTKIGRNLNVVAAYAYADARTTKSNDPAQVGKRTGGVPAGALALCAQRYQLHGQGVCRLLHL